ncbi:MAG: hypothetical protein QF666_00590 [Alphaproteobacteria bacterium]|nr:hypothetical protein [Alphaproteobacteria bacterium]
MSTEIAVFTSKSVSMILDEGGTRSWVLNPERAKRCTYVVLCRKQRGHIAPAEELPEPHGSAFLVGRISNVVPVAAKRLHPNSKSKDRWKITFNEYAKISVTDVWQGWHNPVKYMNLEEFKALGIDVRRLHFKPMPVP